MNEQLLKKVQTSVKEGKVIMGYEETLKKLKVSNEIELIVVAQNTPEHMKKDVMYNAKLAGVEVVEVEENGVELGNICGKPFPVSVLAITTKPLKVKK